MLHKTSQALVTKEKASSQLTDQLFDGLHWYHRQKCLDQQAKMAAVHRRGLLKDELGAKTEASRNMSAPTFNEYHVKT